MGRGQAQTVLYYSVAMDIDYRDEDGLVRDLFKGGHEALFTVYEEAMKVLSDKWEDVDVHILKTYVSMNRNRQFLILLPRKDELVLGLALAEDHDDDGLHAAKNLGPDRTRWNVGVTDAKDLPKYMDPVMAAYEAN